VLVVYSTTECCRLYTLQGGVGCVLYYRALQPVYSTGWCWWCSLLQSVADCILYRVVLVVYSTTECCRLYTLLSVNIIKQERLNLLRQDLHLHVSTRSQAIFKPNSIQCSKHNLMSYRVNQTLARINAKTISKDLWTRKQTTVIKAESQSTDLYFVVDIRIVLFTEQLQVMSSYCLYIKLHLKIWRTRNGLIALQILGSYYVTDYVTEWRRILH